jgi:hypothetical protein
LRAILGLSFAEIVKSTVKLTLGLGCCESGTHFPHLAGRARPAISLAIRRALLIERVSDLAMRLA